MQAILASASQDESEEASDQQLAAIEQLRNTDPTFSTWLDRWLAGAPERSLVELGRNLPENLLSSLGDEFPADQRQTLEQACHLALRARAVQRTFNSDLAVEKRRLLYNLAYGLSHELNNPLASISTRAGVLRDQSEGRERFLLQAIIDNAMRGSELLGDLMLLARPPELRPSEITVEEFFGKLQELATPWAEHRGIALALELDLLDSLLIDAVAMQEAVWCIIRNALEATPQGGRIEIAVRRSSEETVEIVIRDTGPGLSRDALGQCFDPFFSGREAGRGLGLGLAKAERIAVLHGGSLSLRNIESGGCEARFLIPG